MKVDKKYLREVAEAAAGMVMAEKKVNGVTRREQIALAHGIAAALTLVAEGELDGSVPARSEAAQMIAASLNFFAEAADRLIERARRGERADYQAEVLIARKK